MFKEIEIDGTELSYRLHRQKDPSPGVAYVEEKVREMNAFLSGKDLQPLDPCLDLEPPVEVTYRAQTIHVRRANLEVFRAFRPEWQRLIEPRCPPHLHATIDAFCDLSSGLIIADVGFSGGACRHPLPTLEVIEVPALRTAPLPN